MFRIHINLTMPLLIMNTLAIYMLSQTIPPLSPLFFSRNSFFSIYDTTHIHYIYINVHKVLDSRVRVPTPSPPCSGGRPRLLASISIVQACLDSQLVFPFLVPGDTGELLEIDSPPRQSSVEYLRR